MNWLGLAELVGGSVAAPFTGGATLGIAADGLNRITSSKALDKQEKAASDVQAQQKDVLAQQKALYSPYTNLGAGATSLLGAGLGIAMPPMNSGDPGATGAPSAASTPLAPGAGQFAAAPWQVVSGVTGQPRTNGDSVGSVLGPAMQRQSSYSPATVRMQGPDGSTKDVPSYQVPFFKERGAKVI